MAALRIEKKPYGPGIEEVRVSGFTDSELSELKSMEHREAQEKLIDLLDRRNNNIGTNWANGYGIYGIWFDNEFAYLNIGISCD